MSGWMDGWMDTSYAMLSLLGSWCTEYHREQQGVSSSSRLSIHIHPVSFNGYHITHRDAVHINP